MTLRECRKNWLLQAHYTEMTNTGRRWLFTRTEWFGYCPSRPLGSTGSPLVRPFSSENPIQHDLGRQLTLNFSTLMWKKCQWKLSTKLEHGHPAFAVSFYGRHLQESLQFPFLTFMSMLVADGNSDVDHVSVNGKMAHRINDWQKLFGTSVVFFRKCLSKHNTLSPDIRVDLLK